VDKDKREVKQVTSNDSANRPCNRVNARMRELREWCSRIIQ